MFLITTIIDLWLEQEGKEPLLKRVSQWLKKYGEEREYRQNLAREGQKIKTYPPDPIREPQHFEFYKTQKARRMQIDLQHTQAVNDRARDRGDFAPPLPILSFEHLTLAFEYVEVVQVLALGSPLVQDVADSLQRIVKARECDSTMRDAGGIPCVRSRRGHMLARRCAAPVSGTPPQRATGEGPGSRWPGPCTVCRAGAKRL
jgi:hypothetical protein